MPAEFHGLPTHALVIHAAVVLVPLAALLALLFVIPPTRRWAGFPMALVSVAAAVAVYVAKITGQDLKSTLAAQGGGAAWLNGPVGRAVQHHEDLANVLLYLVIAFAVVAVATYLRWRISVPFTGILQVVACLVLLVGAAVVLVQVYRVGEAGAKAVWNPTGTVQYGAAPLGTTR